MDLIIWNILLKIHSNILWKDFLVEFTTLLHSHVDMFVQKHILNDSGILGTVKEYVICYELQHHGVFHIHIILWVQENDLERIKNEIVVVILDMFNESTTKFISPNDSLQNKLFKMWWRSQGGSGWTL
jgi:hypothetical protein